MVSDTSFQSSIQDVHRAIHVLQENHIEHGKHIVASNLVVAAGKIAERRNELVTNKHVDEAIALYAHALKKL
ncbi:hypothetical protein [Desulfocurvibacter africanus]|uniref:hypothetical protein n=1 Tax=Desulfocurvibacter africanus TaxID=873 RepID=UPI0005C170A5|nr:hypothetical protein [Desulfocurvibacter africanus]